MEETNKFTTIIVHDIRLKLKLSCNEYCVCDLIHWNDNVTRKEIAAMMGISKQAVSKLITKLTNDGYLKRLDNKVVSSGLWNINFDEDIENVPKFGDIWLPTNDTFQLFVPPETQINNL